MKKIIDISNLMKAVNINHNGKIIVNENMSGLEKNPRDDWLFLALLSLKHLSQENKKINSIVNIGSGNGIETIAELKLFKYLKKIVVTDIIPSIMLQIRKNIESNVPTKDIKIEYISGRDCEPLKGKFDAIYANLPLVMVTSSRLNKNLATTTLTEAKHYLNLSKGKKDLLRKYSLLSQLGFLLSAKEKLNEDGTIISLLGGRVPEKALVHLFKRAGLKHRELFCAFKRQSDPQFIKQYAEYEKKEKVRFLFYDYEKAVIILKNKLNISVPNIIKGYSGDKIKRLIQDASINANQAYALSKKNKKIGHIAFAFEVRK